MVAGDVPRAGWTTRLCGVLLVSRGSRLIRLCERQWRASTYFNRGTEKRAAPSVVRCYMPLVLVACLGYINRAAVVT